MKPSEVLRAARKLIERPEQWCQRLRLREGDDRVTAYCAEAALDHAPGGGVTPGSVHRAREFLRLATGYEICLWNDSLIRKHSEVLSAFDSAVALAESEGQ